MPFFYFTPVIRTMMVKLKCPSCGKEQVRERKVEGTGYRCQRCGKEFVAKPAPPPPEEEDFQD